MAALPYIQLYVADYLADTVHLETDEHGAYLLLIFNYWQTGRPIPVSRVRKITGLSNERYTDVEQTLLDFFKVVDNCWYHERIEHDLSHVLAKSHAASRAGKKSAEKRKLQAIENKKDLNERSTTVQRTCNHTDTDTDTDTDIKEINKEKTSRFTPPSHKELMDYCNQKLLVINPDAFIDFYQSKDWMVGKNKMKDWKASARNWVRRNKTNGGRYENRSKGNSAVERVERATAKSKAERERENHLR